ncbi:MAG: geranylgeranylglyceryl/heptaprenylglyceryl phosphate synthase [Candidatus Marinimicrobia bacterium]|jgi:phosphoglycerol geranylgeranyltransferase|nr:geranylgeranylglyceryl/heptaprenylglyceryl phosphate synthase [Candidatus Neomarinimicrobiota bacterium]MBT3495803.1 geranylgeranylglyceryl/heptaprenylglyceryl phosphate synthase [Candidatus Neomarinimicrobiota bacterium]MBT3691636.1 geranylgeranylglyceryl/heptaprenylglyceryl phosphate synthase [Candidatus Neomarinimicrobiota bacterium]MBT3732729.1 geranylgeranylglyceryl/heptaprenylglyceryl phosphate synthase [Candidatus Neomarinimicrobiota bacterium]MBT4145011.1 geranylgeranylglyceryl/hepta
MNIFQTLTHIRDQKGAGYIVLIDPDKKNESLIEQQVSVANEAGVDALFVGGSLMMDSKCHERVARIKSASDIPVIFFPGGLSQLNPHYDAMLFMSVISGRNPHYLIGEQVLSAPVVKDLGIETIPTGYMLFDGGANSTVEFMSGTKPIPMNRPDIAVAHGLAGQYLGMKLLYLEAGSGAKISIPTEVISAMAKSVDCPLIVGGGIREPKEAEKRVLAGASFIVTGTVIEDNGSAMMKEFADAIHS